MNVIINAAIQVILFPYVFLSTFDCKHVLSIEESVLLLPISVVKDNVYFKTL